MIFKTEPAQTERELWDYLIQEKPGGPWERSKGHYRNQIEADQAADREVRRRHREGERATAPA